jgi:DNA polymerase III delta prime subunit
MIPPIVDPSTRSPGEREAFLRLASDPETARWSILHSLDISHHRVQVSGEIDFLVVIPRKGAVCLEVKAHRQVSRRNGLWFLGQDQKGDPRGPFKQAAAAMHSIRERLVARFPHLSRVVFWSAVLFPFVEFKEQTDEWHEWQVIDARAWRSRSLGQCIEHVLDNAHEFLAQRRTAAWYARDSGEPNEEQCREIIQFLRPDFEFYESPSDRRKERNEELRKYTGEQLEALDAMEDIPRVVFDGPAGTGKTLLAIEVARRAAARNTDTLFICFNRLLGEWLRKETATLGQLVTCRTLHSHMLDLTAIEPLKGAQDSRFWEVTLPSSAIDHLLDDMAESEKRQYDLLIVDEAQDILRSEYLDVLDLILRGGLASGHWRFFTDSARQAIYKAADIPLETFLQQRSGRATKFRLTVNCRNTPRVAALVAILGGLHPTYGRVRRPDDGIEPIVQFYQSHQHQQEIVCQTLDELIEEGFRGEDIVILSPTAANSCAAQITKRPWCDRLRPVGSHTGGHIRYASIYAFKGLESPAVIVTDVENASGSDAESLLYTAITRTTERLILLVNEGTRKQIAAALKNTKVGGR